MAGYDFEFYETGRISVTAGQKAFTGTGTAWKLRGCEGALIIVAGAGAVNFVSVLSTDAAGEFRTPWTGPTLANAQYTMWLPSAVAATALANHQRLAEIIASIQAAQPESANLTALASLNGDTETLIRFLANGSFDLIKSSDVGIQDPNESLGKLSALTLAANKALTTDENGNAQQINLGTLGRALLTLATGTNAQYVRGDGDLATLNSSAVGLGNVNNTSDAAKPISTATQTALNGKLSTSGGDVSGRIYMLGAWAGIDIRSTAGSQGSLDFAPEGVTEDYTWRLTTGNYRWDWIIRYGGGDGYPTRDCLKVNRNGDLTVVGSLSKASGTFEIDHPLDPFNKNLRHGFVESTEYLNIYRGMVDLIGGRMTVDIDAAFGMTDGTFAALNADVIVSSLQTQYGPERVWVEGPADSGTFTIICENPESTATVAWMITGRRNDAFVRSHLDKNTDEEGRFIPEFDKPEYEDPQND